VDTSREDHYRKQEYASIDANREWLERQAYPAESTEAEDARIDAVLESRLHIGGIRPLAFTSLALNLTRRRDVFREGDSYTHAQMAEWMRNTRMPDLMASIMELAVTNAQATLQFLLGQDEDGISAAPGQQPPAAAAAVRGAVASAAFAAVAAASAGYDSSSSSDTDSEDDDLESLSTVAAAVNEDVTSSSSSSLSAGQNTLTTLRRELGLQLARAKENDTTGARKKLAEKARGLLGTALRPKSGQRLPTVIKDMMENLRGDNEKVRFRTDRSFRRCDRTRRISTTPTLISSYVFLYGVCVHFIETGEGVGDDLQE
jgi:hypothetical protein